MRDAGKGEILITESDRLIGIITERDIMRVLATDRSLETPVREAMTASPIWVRKSETIAAALVQMAQRGFRRLPVVDESGKPIGLIGVTSILHWIVEHFPSTVYNWPPEARVTMREREGA